MRVAIMGAGGIGSYYGARLAKAGHDVHFIARGERLRGMQQRGLEIRAHEGPFRLDAVQATDDPAQVGPVDWVLFCTKAYDLEGAAQRALPLLGPETTVVPVLNGVDIPQRLGAVLGAGRVMQGLTYLPAAVPEPGVMLQKGPQDRLVFGEPDGSPSARGDALAEALRAAGVQADCTPDIQRETWLKFSGICPLAGMACVLRGSVGPALADPTVKAVYTEAVSEVVAVGRAQGVALPEDQVATIVARGEAAPATSKPSMLQDLEAGKPLELETFQGAIVRLGAALGVDTPVSRYIYASLKPHVAGTPKTEAA